MVAREDSLVGISEHTDQMASLPGVIANRMVRPTTEEVVRVALLLTSLWQPGGFSIYGSAAYANLDSHFASDTKAETASGCRPRNQVFRKQGPRISALIVMLSRTGQKPGMWMITLTNELPHFLGSPVPLKAIQHKIL